MPRARPGCAAHRRRTIDRVEPGRTPVCYSGREIDAEFETTVAFWRHRLGRSRSPRGARVFGW
jgi:hypothetical protein